MGQGQTTHKGQNVVTSVICYEFQKSLFEVWFYTHFFMILNMYVARGRRRQPLGDEILMSTGTSCHSVICYKFQKHLFWSLILHTFFHDFIHVYSTRQPLGGQNFVWCQQKGLTTLPIYYKFQKNLFEVWFYTYFFMLLYIYIAGQGQTTLWGQNFDVNRNILSLWSFVVSFCH